METATQTRPKVDPAWVKINGETGKLYIKGGPNRWRGMMGWGQKYIGPFSTEEKRDEYLAHLNAQDAAKAQRHTDRVQAKREAKATIGNPYKLGQVLYTSWGYDQTNIDWYKIVRLTPKGIWIIRIKATSVPSEGCAPMSGHTYPIQEAAEGAKEHFIAIQVSVYGGKSCYHVSIDGHGLSEWDGSAKYESWYA